MAAAGAGAVAGTEVMDAVVMVRRVGLQLLPGNAVAARVASSCCG